MHPEGAELALPGHPLPAEVRLRGCGLAQHRNACRHAAVRLGLGMTC